MVAVINASVGSQGFIEEVQGVEVGVGVDGTSDIHERGQYRGAGLILASSAQ